MKYLGIDYGDKRIGIAVSDSGGRIAFPKKVIFNRGPNIYTQIKTIIEEENASKIVIGIPLAFDGKETEQSKKTRAFAGELGRAISLAIEFENELLTTHMVEGVGIKKEHTDEAAAALILQSFLDRLNKSSYGTHTGAQE